MCVQNHEINNPIDRSILMKLLKEAHDEIEWMNRQYLQDDPMGLRSTPPRILRLLDKMKGILGE